MIKNFLVMTAVILFTALPGFAKEWNGIKPLQTGRDEVIKLLGSPVSGNQEKDLHKGEHFRIDKQEVYIIWTRADCRDEEMSDGFPPALKQILGSPPVGLNVVAYKIKVMQQSPPSAEARKRRLPGFRSSFMELDYRAGFGRSKSDNGVIGFYYFPSDTEYLSWKEKVLPCSAETN